MNLSTRRKLLENRSLKLIASFIFRNKFQFKIILIVFYSQENYLNQSYNWCLYRNIFLCIILQKKLVLNTNLIWSVDKRLQLYSIYCFIASLKYKLKTFYSKSRLEEIKKLLAIAI